MDKQYKNLLIIGNGYDKHCGLMSSFEDYFSEYTSNALYHRTLQLYSKESTLYEYIELFKDFNNDSLFSKITSWELLFLLKNNEQELSKWKDVENAIYNSLTINIEKKSTFKNSWDICKSMCIGLQTFTDKTNTISSYGQILGVFIYLKSNLYTDYEIHTGFYELLLKDLKRFEHRFSDFINKQINTSYKKIATDFLLSIQKSLNLDEYIHNILSFNYTYPFYGREFIVENVHGLISNESNSIIIGIDSSDIQIDHPGYLFTKTNRKLEMNVYNYNKIVNKVLHKKFENLIFYGHSLGKQDYAYFQSIFDYLDIYNEGIKLIFLYTVFDNSIADSIKKEQIDNVKTLIESYGKTHLNTHQGKNLLHKLLLEGRIKILEIS